MTNKTYQPTIGGIRAFVALARHRHFGDAAAELGVSQPSLSQALAGLEAGLELPLIERTTRRVLVTPEGEALLPKAIALLDAVDEFLVTASDGGSPVLRVGVIPTVAPYLLPVVLGPLIDEGEIPPFQIIEDQTERLLAALRSGSIDLAVIALPADVPGVTEIPLYREDFVLAMGPEHPLAGRKRVDPKVLADLPLLLLDEGHCLRDQTLDVCAMAGIQADLAPTRAASLATAVHMVRAGMGVTLLPQTAVDFETAHGDLAVAAFSRPRPGRIIGLVHRSAGGRAEDYRRLASLVTRLMVATGQVSAVAVSAPDRAETPG